MEEGVEGEDLAVEQVEDKEAQLAGGGEEELEEVERGSVLDQMIQELREEPPEGEEWLEDAERGSVMDQMIQVLREEPPEGEEWLEEVERGSVLGRMIRGLREESPEKGEVRSEEWAR